MCKALWAWRLAINKTEDTAYTEEKKGQCGVHFMRHQETGHSNRGTVKPAPDQVAGQGAMRRRG